MMQTPDGDVNLELAKYHSPPSQAEVRNEPANTPGIRHILFSVDDIKSALAGLQAHGGELVGELENYEDSYWLCYVRGPAGSSLSWRRRSARNRTAWRPPPACRNASAGSSRSPHRWRTDAGATAVRVILRLRRPVRRL